MSDQREIGDFVDRLVSTGQVTAAAAVVEWRSGRRKSACRGRLGPEDGDVRVDSDSLFDLASLTKAFSGALASVLDQSGELPLVTPLGEIWPQAPAALRSATMEDLLRHRAGLRRWLPLYTICRQPEDLPLCLFEAGWNNAPAGTYSDLGSLLWALSVERQMKQSYLELLRQRLLAGLGEGEFSWAGVADRPYVGCRLPTGREVELAAAVGLEIDEQPPPERGQPQDGNCRFLGRPLGHAGLFGTATGVVALGRQYLRPGDILSREAVERSSAGTARYGVGWFGQQETRAGRALGRRAFGHEGFTGGSLWIDPDNGLIAVLLAHRASLDVDLVEARVAFHRLVLSL